jgi:hypothetical protein
MPDAIISDITVVLDARYAEDAKTDEAVAELKKHGMTVDNVDYSNSTVEGTCPQDKVHHLQQLDAVDYVRTTFTYYADYPSTDPRNVKGDDD